MSKINYLLQSRIDAVKKRAAEYTKHNSDSAYKNALNHQVKYGRKGWIQYDAPNHYHDGDLCLESLNSFDAVPIQEISRRAFDYTGYYADSFQWEMVMPYIVRIKTSKGLFIAPAIAYNDSDIATIYLSRGEFCNTNNIDSDLAHSRYYEMARIADCIAEKLADDGRECDAKFQAENQIEGFKYDNKAALKAARALIQGIRDQRDIGQIVTPICNALMAEIKSIRQSIHANNERIGALKNNYWLSVE